MLPKRARKRNASEQRLALLTQAAPNCKNPLELPRNQAGKGVISLTLECSLCFELILSGTPM